MTITAEDEFIAELDRYFVEYPLTPHARTKILSMLKQYRTRVVPARALARPEKVITIWKRVSPTPMGKNGRIKKFTPNSIMKVVCEYFDVQEGDVIRKGRKRELVHARFFCMYFIYQYTQLSLKKVGKIMSGRDHTTVTHGIRVIKDRISVEEDTARDYYTLLNIFGYGKKIKTAKNKSAVLIRETQGAGNRAV